MRQKKIIALLFVFIFLFSLANACWAEGTWSQLYDQTKKTTDKAGYAMSSPTSDLPIIIQYVISAFLGLLGIIFLVLMIYAGYNWMTAQGDEEKVTLAKNTLTRAVIGLIIIALAYAITYFIFTSLPGSGGGGADITTR